MTERDSNMDVPLRVRLTASEDARLQQAADHLRLTRSVFVRWAIRNAAVQVLGAEPLPAGQQQVQPQKPPRRPQQTQTQRPAPVARAPVQAPVPSVEALFAAAVEARPGELEAATFDDSDWS